MIYFLVPAKQDDLIKDYLAVWGRSLQADFEIIHYEALIQRREFKQGTYVLSALDQLTPDLEQVLLQVYRQLQPLAGFRFLNNPQTLRRFELLSELRRLGRNEFQAVRANSDLNGLKFPVFLREERAHNGAISPLLRSEREIHQALGKALIQGYELRNLLVLEFCDTSDEFGIYRKYAAFVVGERVIARSLNYGRHWMLKHSKTEFNRPMVLEELDYVTNNPHQKELMEIFKLAQVEYGRIDYAIKEGKIETWEINLYPTIGRGLLPGSGNVPPELQPLRDEVKRQFYQRFERAWRELDTPRQNNSAVRLSIQSETVQVRDPDSVRQHKLLGAMRTVIRPAKPLIEPLSPPLLIAIGRLSRWVRQKRG